MLIVALQNHVSSHISSSFMSSDKNTFYFSAILYRIVNYYKLYNTEKAIITFAATKLT